MEDLQPVSAGVSGMYVQYGGDKELLSKEEILNEEVSTLKQEVQKLKLDNETVEALHRRIHIIEQENTRLTNVQKLKSINITSPNPGRFVPNGCGHFASSMGQNEHFNICQYIAFISMTTALMSNNCA